MVSNQGYQKSALEFAAHYGISFKQLRRPRADEVIGEVNMKSHLCLRHRVFLIDEGWIADHNFDIERLRQFYASFQVKKSKYWLSATHFPIETKDHIIRDSSGIQISSIEELERQLPEQLASPITFSFEDGWLESKHWGSVRIKEVKFEEENEIQEISLILLLKTLLKQYWKMPFVEKWTMCPSIEPPSSCSRRRASPSKNGAAASTVWPSVTVTNPTTPSLSASTSMQPAAAECGTALRAGALTLSPGTQSPTSWLPVCTKPPRDIFPATGSAPHRLQ